MDRYKTRLFLFTQLKVILIDIGNSLVFVIYYLSRSSRDGSEDLTRFTRFIVVRDKEGGGRGIALLISNYYTWNQDT